ncbi:TPA: 3-keto-5-aminohexanoate cleavage protein, partial [Citrobacter freundii]|nr:3-keto-5-aminohexanoate cleavage protein [Citrobacter freundii]
AAAVGMGASEVRIGFEDSYYLSVEEKAQNNYQQVAKLATLIRSMDKKVATPDIARQMLAIPPRQ